VDFAPFTWITTVISITLGAALSFVAQLYLTGRARRSAAGSQFRMAVAAFATAVQVLQSAEFQRGSMRIKGATDAEREPARQDVFRLRGEAWSAYYVLRLAADEDRFNPVLEKAKQLIELARQISAETGTPDDLSSRSAAVSAALDAMVDDARRLSPRD
jgi:hypothetical protein